MSKPGKARWPLMVALALPLVALAGVSTTLDPAPSVEPSQTAAAVQPARSAHAPVLPQRLYQMRCWQEGRLLFEENGLMLPAENGRFAFKTAGTDRHGSPVFVADTKNATCLIRSMSEDRSWPPLPH